MKKSFISYLESHISYLKSLHRFGTAINYQRTLNSLLLYKKGEDILFKEITITFAEAYSDWLKARGIKRNSISFYMRILRAVYNKGVKEGLVTQSYPFRTVYTGIDKTRKRCIDKKLLKKMKSLDLSSSPQLELTRDIFLFGLYARGMSFVDIAFLRQKDIRGHEINYIRRKTGQELSIRLEAPLRSLIHKYKHGKKTDFIFPILSMIEDMDVYTAYTRALSRYNYRLKKLSEMIGNEVELSSYTVRHTWANLARQIRVPLAVISQGMGHSSQRTTEIYLKEIDSDEIHAANRKVLRLLGC